MFFIVSTVSRYIDVSSIFVSRYIDTKFSINDSPSLNKQCLTERNITAIHTLKIEKHVLQVATGIEAASSLLGLKSSARLLLALDILDTPDKSLEYTTI
jgi:hypothetical protein